MNSPFDAIKVYILRLVKYHSLFDSEGYLLHPAKWIKLMNSLPSMVVVSRVFPDMYTELINSPLKEFLNMPNEFLSDQQQYYVVRSIEPSFMMYMHNKHRDCRRGWAGSEEVTGFLYDKDYQLVEVNCYSFCMSFGDDQYKRLYCMHLMSTPSKMRLVKAYSLFDFFSLSARQQEVLTLFVYGHNKAEIATRLEISISTVEKHIFQILCCCGLQNQADLCNAIHL